ncbi:MAG: HepT-like ribonuclease domain-containing protein [Egibacteraceae bacterium]
MSPRSTLRLLDDILNAITRIRAYRATDPGVPVDLAADAILRRLAIIGEAAAQLGAAERALAADVPWGDIIGLRNRVAHDYDEIDWAIIDDVIDNDLESLARQVTALRALQAREQVAEHVEGNSDAEQLS